MSSSLSQEFELWCLLYGEKAPFLVNIAANKSVYQLKKSIKNENPNTLANVDARELTLYYIDNVNIISETSDLELSSKGRLLQDEMQPLQEIIHDDPQRTSRIIVKPPGK
jgi:hypothetical protein